MEKDALNGIFEDLLAPYGVTLKLDVVTTAGTASGTWPTGTVKIIMPPSFTLATSIHQVRTGEDMVRSLKERLGFFDCRPSILKCALNLDDIRKYSLPPDFTKKSDTRQKKFVEQFVEFSVELDVLPIDVLRDRIKAEIDSRMSLSALATTHETEDHERLVLRSMLERLS